MTDTFSAERAGFAERLGRLAGGTTYREPMEGHSTAGGHMPDVHAIAAALAFARRGKEDIGPDVAEAVVFQRMVRPERVCHWLGAELREHCGRTAERNLEYLVLISRRSYEATVVGNDPVPLKGVDSRDFDILSSIGMSMLWQAMMETIARAERAYRAQS